MKAYELTIWGDVQGVSYRYFAKREAKSLGLFGYTENNHDGTVKIFIQGESDRIDDFITWTKEGSPMATVEKVGVKEAGLVKDLKEFEVK